MDTCDYEDDSMFCVLEVGHLDDHRFMYVIETVDGTVFRTLTHEEYREEVVP